MTFKLVSSIWLPNFSEHIANKCLFESQAIIELIFDRLILLSADSRLNLEQFHSRLSFVNISFALVYSKSLFALPVVEFSSGETSD